MDGCLDEPQVLAFLGGQLPPAEKRAAESHVETCEPCLELLAELGKLAAAPLGSPAPNATARTTTARTPTARTETARTEERAKRASRSASTTRTEARYDLRDPIARGGMGQIRLAYDRELGREVAIKTVRTSKAAHLAARFRREMMITARLQHPSIIAIYDAGILPTGEPFYAMRRVQGQTLDQALEDQTLPERLARLPQLIALVDAIAYAHDQGVIHRDIKPANVLLGPFGETVVLDWGLAKRIDSETDTDPDPEPDPEADTDPEPEPEPEPDPDPDPDPVATEAGQVMGTPGYMAPEQADGQPADRRSDVYGLGAVLGQLLSGKPPRPGIGPTFPPNTPADLAAIAHRATAAEPADRYDTAAALGDDLRRFQAGAIVSAHNYSARQLLSRWLRRHRAIATVTAAAVLALTILGTLAITRIIAERERAQTERATAVNQREAAQTLLDFTLVKLRGKLEKVGRLELMADLGTHVDAYYESAGARSALDHIHRANAHSIVGDVALASGDTAAAQTAYTKSLAAFEQAAAENPTDATTASLSRAHERIADVHKALGDLDAALQSYEQAKTLADQTKHSDAKLLSARARVNIAFVLRMQGKPDRAKTLLSEAKQLLTTAPNNDDRTTLTLVINQELRRLALARADLSAAETLATDSLTLAQTQLAKDPNDADAKSALATVHVDYGYILENQDKPDRARKNYDKALALTQELATLDPTNADWVRKVSTVHDHLGNLAMHGGDLPKALTHLRASQAIAEKLHHQDPSNADWLRDIGVSALTIGDVEKALGNTAAGRRGHTAAVATFRKLRKTNPTSAAVRFDLAVALLHLGDLELAAKNHTSAAKALSESAELIKAALAEADDLSLRHTLIQAVMLLATAQSESGKPDLARTTIKDALEIAKPLRKLTDVPDVRTTLEDLDKTRAALLGR